jgi:hypothetical protein
MTLPAETQRRTRGHNFYPPKDVRTKVPALHSTADSDDPFGQAVHVHYFVGGFDWWITEADWETGMAFGIVRSPMCPDGEWGSIFLPELEEVRPSGSYTPTGNTQGLVGTGTLQWVVERDCFWTAKTVTEAMGR